MNIMKNILLATGFSLLSAVVTPAGAATSVVEIEAGMFGGTLYNLSYALSEVFKAQHPDIKLVPVETTGNAAGIVKASASPGNRLVAGSALPLQEAVKGVSPFPRKFEKFRFVAGACVHAETLITLDPEIKTLADLSGKRIGLGPQPSMQGRTMWSIMRDSIPGSDKIKPFWMNWSSLKDSMIDGSLDCMVLGVGIIPDGPWQPISVYAEIVASRGNPHLIPFVPEKLAEAAKRDGFIYPPLEIPANAIAPGVPSEPTLAWSEQLGFYAFEDLPDDVAYAVFKTLYESGSLLTKYTPDARGTAPETVLPPKELPDSLIHPGTLRYLKEKGLR